MEQDKMGRFIAEERKALGLTQKALAECLGITDKAVSKWERGLSCPDITLLKDLSAALGVTVSELLSGERAETNIPGAATIVESTLRYADTTTRNRSKTLHMVLFMLLTLGSMIGIGVCVICDLAISGYLTWSWYVISAVIFAWLLLAPVARNGRAGILLSLIAGTLTIVPFLYAIERIIGMRGLILPIGIPVSALAIVYTWSIYALFTRTGLFPYAAGAATLALSILLEWAIDFTISRFFPQPVFNMWDIFAAVLLLASSCVLLVFGYLRHGGLRKASCGQDKISRRS